MLNLLRLAQMTDRAEFRAAAEKALRVFAPNLAAGPVGVPQMLVAFAFSLAKPKQVILVGDPRVARTWAPCWRLYMPLPARQNRAGGRRTKRRAGT